MMDNNELKKFANEMSKLTDKQLAKKFVEVDIEVLRLWQDVDNDTMDEHTILQDLIIERYVAAHKIGLIWSDVLQAWVKPIAPDPDLRAKRINYWVVK